jgi:hypothetical protein
MNSSQATSGSMLLPLMNATTFAPVRRSTASMNSAADLVFCDEVGGHQDDNVVRDEFYEALAAAELGHLREQDDPIVFHDLRHTFGTQCAAKGIDRARSRHGWATPISRPRCATSTTCRRTTTPQGSRPRSRPQTCPEVCPELATCPRKSAQRSAPDLAN